MKSIRRTALVAVMSGLLLSFSHAQEISPNMQTSDWQSILQALEATQPQPASQRPDSVTIIPLNLGQPGHRYRQPDGLTFWPLGGGFYVYDDRNVD